jgi:hypothetical protein
MAKSVKQAIVEAEAHKARLADMAAQGSRSVSVDFTKGFSQTEIEEIKQLRSEMADRLYAAG